MLKIGTWNVQNLFLPGGDGPRTKAAYKAKLAGLASTILGSGVDAVAVQEIGQPEAFEELIDRLGAGWSGLLSRFPDPRRGIRVGVIARTLMSRVADDVNLAPGLPAVCPTDSLEVSTRMSRGALTVVLSTGTVGLTLTTAHLTSKLISYPEGRIGPRHAAERARFAAYSTLQRASEAATVRGVVDRLLNGQGHARRAVLLGDFNDEPRSATTQMLLGPPGSQLGTSGAEQPDSGDGSRLFNLSGLIPAERQHSRVLAGHRELIDHILVSHALLHTVSAVDTVPAALLPSISTTRTTTATTPFSDHAMVMASLDL